MSRTSDVEELLDEIFTDYTPEAVEPIKAASDDDGKLDQAVVLYFPGNIIANKAGTRCDQCWKFIKTGACVEVEGTIEPQKTCALYVHGKPFEIAPALDITKVSQSMAGYADGNTNCGNCEYFGGPGRCKKVKSSPAPIEAEGCCGHHDPE